MGRDVIFEFDPYEIAGVEPNPDTEDEVRQECADFTVEKILDYVASENSPVQGHGKFKRLSKKYKHLKEKAGYSGVPDLSVTGNMLNALKATVSGDTIRVGITGKEGDKADGHCNLSGESRLPTRRFIPGSDESFKGPILEGIRRIVKAGSSEV